MLILLFSKSELTRPRRLFFPAPARARRFFSMRTLYYHAVAFSKTDPDGAEAKADEEMRQLRESDSLRYFSRSYRSASL